MVKQAKIDEVDVKLLKALIKNARTSFAEIARDCGISTNAIVKRFYRLKDMGVIAGTSLIVDSKVSGHKFNVSIGINVEKNEEIRLLEKLKKIPNIFDFQQQLGSFDVHAVGIANSLQEINRVRDIIKRCKGVKRIKITTSVDERVIFPENLLIQPSGTGENGQN